MHILTGESGLSHIMQFQLKNWNNFWSKKIIKRQKCVYFSGFYWKRSELFCIKHTMKTPWVTSWFTWTDKDWLKWLLLHYTTSKNVINLGHKIVWCFSHDDALMEHILRLKCCILSTEILDRQALCYCNTIKISTCSNTFVEANCDSVWHGAAMTVASLYGVSRGQ